MSKSFEQQKILFIEAKSVPLMKVDQIPFWHRFEFFVGGPVEPVRYYLGEIRYDTTAETNDNVNHPSHYTFGKYEVFDVLQDWFAEQPLLWQVVKYLSRAKHKGNYAEDLKKAQWYLNKAIEEADNAAH